MGSQVPLITGNPAGQAFAASTTFFSYVGAGGGIDKDVNTEANTQVVHRAAGTWSNLNIRLSVNGATTNGSIQSRVNTANGTQTQTITNAVTGIFEDTVHTDTIASGDKLAFQLVVGATAGYTVTVMGGTFQASAAGTTVSRLICSELLPSVGGAAAFFCIAGGATTGPTTEAPTKVRVRRAGTLTNLAIRNRANSATNAVFLIRQNGANTTQTTGTMASGAATVEDTTHTTTVAAGDDICYSLSANNGNLSIDYAACNFETTTGYGMSVNSSTALFTIAKGTTRHFGLGGIMNASGGETFQQSKPYLAYTFSDITMLITTASTAVATLTFRKNTANGNQTIASTASVAGVYSDTTHTDVVATTDLINSQIVTDSPTGTANTTFSNIAINSFIAPPASVPLYLQPVFNEWIVV